MTGGDPQGFRLRREGDLGAQHPGRLRQVRAELGLRELTAVEGDALYVRCCTDEDDGPVLHPEDRHDDRQDVWRVERPNPAVRESPGVHHAGVIEANGRRTDHHRRRRRVRTRSATGKEYWRADVLNPTRNGAYRIVASPTIVNDLIIAPTRVSPMVAMRPGACGDVANTHVVWKSIRDPTCPPRQRRQV